jgi:RNA polymerase sigma factor (sigma-70 family)
MKASEIEPRKLVVFDIDDTLVHTQTKVHVVKDGGIIDSLNSHDFTHYRLKPGEEFDFSGFRNAREFFEKSKPIIPMMNQLKRDIATGNKVVMVTARADFDDRELFLDTFRKFGIDMGKVHVYRAGNSKEGSTEERKKAIIKSLLDKGDYTKAIMYDDAKPNLHTFMELKRDHPRTKFYAWHVSLEGEASEYMREHIEEKWSEKYKRSINCSSPKGFSQRAHCQGRKKNENVEIDTRLDVNKALDTLDPKLKDVIEMRFQHDMTFDEIGKELGVGKERARQIVMRALRYLRHPKRGLMSEPEVDDFQKRDELKWSDAFKENFAESTLNEYRNSLYDFVKSKFTSWPEYVLRDFLYAQAKGIRDQQELKDFLERNQKDFGQVKWRLEKLPITLDIFTAKTQGMIRQREGGSSNPFQVPKDAERHALQQRMIQQKGVSPEPIIVAKLSNGYDLIEGWHRTIQHLKAYPEGYTGPAWVGYGATYTSELKPGLAEGIDPDTFEELDARIIARAAKQIVPTIRAKNTPEGYVHVTTEDGLDLYIGAGVADGVISVYIGSGGGVTTSGARKGAVTEIIRSVYHAAVRKYGEPDTPGELTIDHDAGHGVWQHIADKLGLTYAAVKVKESGIRPDDVSENFADGKKPGRKGLSKRVGIPKKASLGQLKKIASSSSGERRRMAQWQLNMRRGKAKANK